MRDIQLHICILLQYPHRDQETELYNSLIVEYSCHCSIFRKYLKMFNIQTSNQVLKQAKHLRQIARRISRSLGPGSSVLNSLPERLIQVHPEVAEALVRRKPIVALESTIITHGMPYPENIRYC